MKRLLLHQLQLLVDSRKTIYIILHIKFSQKNQIHSNQGIEERLGEMRKGRRERMRKGALFLQALRVLQVGAQASKFGFF